MFFSPKIQHHQRKPHQSVSVFSALLVHHSQIACHSLSIISQTSLTCLRNLVAESCSTAILFKSLDLIPVITKIINHSFSAGSVRPFKHVPVISLTLTLMTYHPVSNNPFLSQILEEVIFPQLLEHFAMHILEPFQQAYPSVPLEWDCSGTGGEWLTICLSQPYISPAYGQYVNCFWHFRPSHSPPVASSSPLLFTAFVQPLDPVICHSGLQYHRTTLLTSGQACHLHRLFASIQQTWFCQTLDVDEQITGQWSKKQNWSYPYSLWTLS